MNDDAPPPDVTDADWQAMCRREQRLLSAAARALERVEVGDAGEAEMILSQVVKLDGTYVEYVEGSEST